MGSLWDIIGMGAGMAFGGPIGATFGGTLSQFMPGILGQKSEEEKAKEAALQAQKQAMVPQPTNNTAATPTATTATTTTTPTTASNTNPSFWDKIVGKGGSMENALTGFAGNATSGLLGAGIGGIASLFNNDSTKSAEDLRKEQQRMEIMKGYGQLSQQDQIARGNPMQQTRNNYNNNYKPNYS